MKNRLFLLSVSRKQWLLFVLTFVVGFLHTINDASIQQTYDQLRLKLDSKDEMSWEETHLLLELSCQYGSNEDVLKVCKQLDEYFHPSLWLKAWANNRKNLVTSIYFDIPKNERDRAIRDLICHSSNKDKEFLVSLLKELLRLDQDLVIPHKHSLSSVRYFHQIVKYYLFP